MALKIFLDENIPERFQYGINNSYRYVVQFMIWIGVKNGYLLRLMISRNFQVYYYHPTCVYLDRVAVYLSGHRTTRNEYFIVASWLYPEQAQAVFKFGVFKDAEFLDVDFHRCGDLGRQSTQENPP